MTWALFSKVGLLKQDFDLQKISSNENKMEEWHRSRGFERINLLKMKYEIE